MGNGENILWLALLEFYSQGSDYNGSWHQSSSHLKTDTNLATEMSKGFFVSLTRRTISKISVTTVTQALDALPILKSCRLLPVLYSTAYESLGKPTAVWAIRDAEMFGSADVDQCCTVCWMANLHRQKDGICKSSLWNQPWWEGQAKFRQCKVREYLNLEVFRYGPVAEQ
jgi:hypothetical protein